MIINAQLSKKQLTALQQALKQLTFPPRKRQRLLWRLARYGVIVAAKRNVRNQQSADGRPWPGRKTRQRGRMLRRMPALLHIREMPRDDAVRLYLQGGGYRNGEKPVPAGVVGYGQQHGMHQTINRRSLTRITAPDQPATLRQAKRLRELGYRVKRGKRWRKPPYKELTENMRFAQAGLLIRKLSGRAAASAWTTDVPAREFLGMSDNDFTNALARQLQAIGFGWDVKAQNMKGH